MHVVHIPRYLEVLKDVMEGVVSIRRRPGELEQPGGGASL
jgi:hypothetical protein